MIQSESFSLAEHKLNRTYFYSDNRLLVADEDALNRRSYQYDATSLLNQFLEKAEGPTGQSKEIRIQNESKNGVNSWVLAQGDQQSQTYELDEFGRVRARHGKTYHYGPNGRVEKIAMPNDSVVEYGYDEAGKRLLKKVNGEIVELYVGDRVITPQSVLQPVKANGVVLGVLENDQLIPLPADLRGSILEASSGAANFHSPFGERKEPTQSPHQKLIDFAAQGYDSDLEAFRMEQRDYDPVSKRL